MLNLDEDPNILDDENPIEVHAPSELTDNKADKKKKKKDKKDKKDKKEKKEKKLKVTELYEGDENIAASGNIDVISNNAGSVLDQDDGIDNIIK